MIHEFKGLGFRPGSVDERDYSLMAAARRIEAPKTTGSKFWVNPMRLDQGAEGACVGFGWMQNINSSPKRAQHSNEEALALYHRAQEAWDEWPGTNYEGTSVRAGAKATQEKGWIASYAFSYDVEEVAFWIINEGPVVIGVDWYRGFFNPTKEDNYFLRLTGAVEGGHCTLLDGVRFNRNDRDYFRGLNSWGWDWGFDGRFKMTFDVLDKLLTDPSGVACTSVEV